MKSIKKFDSVKMMREIRDKVSSDIKDMSAEEILEYIKKGRNEYDKQMASRQHGESPHEFIHI
jgi:hypothetical protein